MRFRRPAFLIAVLITAGVSGAAAQAAGTTVQSGWWNEAVLGPLAVPTTTPSDELQVSYGFSGPLAFAAVRITPPPGTPAADKVTLQLAIPTASSVGPPAVSACVTTSSWKPGADQSPSAAPGYNCNNGFRVDGAVSGSDESWTVPAIWQSGGSISLALVPTAGTTTPFSVSYDQPTPSSVAFNAPSSSVTPVPPASEPAPVSSFAPSPAGAGSVAPTAPAVAVAPATGAATNPSLGSLPSGSAGRPSSSSGAPAQVSAPPSAAPGGGVAPTAPSRRIPHLVAFVLLIGVAVALFGLAGQPERAPRLLGPLGVRLVDRRRPRRSAVTMPARARANPSAPMGGGARLRDPSAPMGGGARMRAYRDARLARTRGTGAVSTGPAAVLAAPSHGTTRSHEGSPFVAPVRGIGRFARPRYGPPRRI